MSLENSCATSCFDLGLNARVCFIAAYFPPSDAVSHFAFLTPCLATYQCCQSSRVMFCAPQATWEEPGLSVSSENTSQKMFIGNDTTSETVNNSDSDGGNFSELSDSDTCKVHSPFSSSSSKEEKIVQPEPDRRRKKTQDPS